MELIVAVDENWAIGRENQLLVHLPGDLKYFKERTMGKVVIMGRSTLESLPGGKPLPGRTNLVISRNRQYRKDGCIIVSSIEEAVAKAEEITSAADFSSAPAIEPSTGSLSGSLLGPKNGTAVVMGGASIYRQMLLYCDICYVTKIEKAFPADVYFPNLDQDPNFELVWESPRQEEKGISYRFTEYRRRTGEPGVHCGENDGDM